MNKIIAILCLILLAGCGTKMTKEEIQNQRNKLKEAIVKSVPNVFILKIYPFQNHAREADLEYLTNAIQDIIYTHMKPIENETMYIPFETLDLRVTADILASLSMSNSIYSNYVESKDVLLTQMTSLLVTNTIQTVGTNSNLVVNPNNKKLKKWITMVYTNSTQAIETIPIIAKIDKTNLTQLTKEKLVELITNEFPELTNTLTMVPIVLKKETDQPEETKATNTTVQTQTSGATNQLPLVSTNAVENYSGTIRGGFYLVQKKIGPNEMEFRLKLTKITTSTNSIDISANSREDVIAEKTFGLLKKIRQFILNRPTGDIYIVSAPDEANVYMDGYFLGKTPLYYPAVPIGNHQFSFLKQGYRQVTLGGTVLENMTNTIFKSIERFIVGGQVTLDSNPTNAQVFVDSLFAGTTPLLLTNLSVGNSHRVKFVSQDASLYPRYHVFTLKSSNQNYQYTAQLHNYEGNPDYYRAISWGFTYASWAATMGSLGVSIYAHYMTQYFIDRYVQNNSDAVANYYIGFYNNLNTSADTFMRLFAVASMGLTAFSLYNDEVYLGLQVSPDRSMKATVIQRF